ncbi:MAG: tRNA (guanine(46)-N(7))-methyltransferase TrmB [Alphaproteobacteria bacterium]
MSKKNPPPPALSPWLRFFGRRSGKKLTARKQALLHHLLPTYQMTPTELKHKEFWANHKHWWLEVGFGGGENLYHWAYHQPSIGFIGAEAFQPAVAKLLVAIDDGKKPLPNVNIHPNNIHQILPAMPDGCLDRIIILYPDPWPKKRHALRRMVSPISLPLFYRLLKKNGRFIFATDQAILLQSTMVCFQQDTNFRWVNHNPCQWLERPDFILPSRYEIKSHHHHKTQKKFGKTPSYLIYEKIA